MTMCEPPSLARNPDFVRLWVGQVASTLGSQISAVAFPLVALSMTGSPVDAGAIASVQLVAMLLGRLPAGTAADTWDRRRLMLGCDLVRSAAMAGVFVLHAFGQLMLAHIAIVVFVDGTLTVLFQPAETAALRYIVPSPQLGRAVAANEARSYLATLLGPVIGGALFAAQITLPFLANAFTYLLSYLCVRSLRRPLQEERRPEESRPRRTRLVRNSGVGFAWLWRRKFLRSVVLWVAGVNVVFNSIGLVVVVLAKDHGASPTAIGLMFAITGGGGLIGALVADRVQRRFSPAAVVIGFGWMAAAAAALLPVVASPLGMGVLGGVAFLAAPVANTMVLTRVIATAPDDMQGRITNTVRLAIGLAVPFGPTLAGFVLAAFGATRAALLYAALLAILALTATATPSIRSARQRLL